MLLGVQLDDQVLLDGQIDVLAGGHLHHGAFSAFLSRSSHLAPEQWGASPPVRRLNLTEERLDSLTSITSPALTR